LSNGSRECQESYAVFNLAGTNREGTSRDEKLILIMNLWNDDDYDLLT